MSGDGENVEAVAVEPKAYDCPECPTGSTSFPAPELLGAHLERHRPVAGPQFSRRGKAITAPCPSGCGRHFLLKGDNSDARAHKAICDGSPPIVGVAVEAVTEKEATVAKLSCEKGCGKEFTHQAWKDKHEAVCGGAGSKPVRKKIAKALVKRSPFLSGAPVANGAGPIAAAIAQLRTRREEIIATHPELLEIEQAIEALEKVASGARPT